MEGSVEIYFESKNPNDIMNQKLIHVLKGGKIKEVGYSNLFTKVPLSYSGIKIINFTINCLLIIIVKS